MKNWVLWLVVSLVFIGGAVTFFILWNKEKKKNGTTAKTNMNGSTSGINTAGMGAVPVTAESSETETTVTSVGDGGRVAISTPSSFGTQAN